MNTELLKKIHKYYMVVKSLNQTVEWVQKTMNLEVNRHYLSKEFHREGLYVQPPNGRGESHFIDPVKYMDCYGALAGKMLEDAWKDVKHYLKGRGNKADYMTACKFISSDFYTACIGTLMRRVDSLAVDENTIPSFVTIDEIIEGREMYDRGLQFWVMSPG